MHPRALFELRRSHARVRGNHVRFSGVVARERADDVAVSVENVECQLSFRLARQVVVNVRTHLWILRLVGWACVRRSSGPATGTHSIGVLDRKKMSRRRGNACVDLVQRRQVIEDPEASIHGRHDEVFVDHLEVGNRRHRKIELKRLPAFTVVERDEHPELGTGVKESFAIGIFTHHPHGMVVGNTVVPCGDPSPGFAVVGGLIGVRCEISELVPEDRRIGLGRLMRRDFDVLHAAVGPDPGWGHVLPAHAVVA